MNLILVFKKIYFGIIKLPVQVVITKTALEPNEHTKLLVLMCVQNFQRAD